ncbi:MAG: zinc ribbon domain-containing protein [Pyrinomonadaceae bacterium]|nr:zinc ribbon domain-containing protein [Pyrinomonadaceae bacterium]
MFCPKCGTKNPDDGRFCRSCGGGLSNVPAALANVNLGLHPVGRGKKDPDELFAEAVKNLIFGVGFLIISIVLFATNVAGGKVWWWSMLFPAVSFIAMGTSNYLKSKRLERKMGVAPLAEASVSLPGPAAEPAPLPPAREQFVTPESRYKTGDLVPPSVTDDTTKHLKMDNEGETMTLPKL